MGSWGAVSCSHFPPPSFLPLHPLPSSSPPLSCITSCGDREERSEACSSPSVSHLVNCFPSSSPPYCTNSGIFFVLYFFCETQSYRKSAFFFSFHGDTFEEKTPVFQTCSYDSVLLLWYSDPVIIPLWLPLYVSTGVVKIGLLLCPCCQTFGEGCSVWSLTLEELKRGRRGSLMWSNTWRCWMWRFYIPFLDKPGRRLLFYKGGRSVLFWERLFSSLLQHGWDVWMLQEQEVSYLLS